MRKTLFACFSSIIVALFLLEGFLSFFAEVNFRKPLDKKPAGFGYSAHRAASTPGLHYELRPGSKTKFREIDIAINSQGMRSFEEPNINDKNVFRVAILGDSFAFGWGINEADGYPHILQSLLRGKYPNRKIEVLNFGVSGYSTEQQAIAFKTKVATWQPDIIVLSYFPNDPLTTWLTETDPEFFKIYWWQHLNIGRLVNKLIWHFEKDSLGDGDLYRYIHHPKTKFWNSVLEGFSSIHDNLPPSSQAVVTILPDTHSGQWPNYPYKDLNQQVSKAALERGFSVIDTTESLKHFSVSQLTLSATDHHFTRFANEKVAEELLNWIGSKPENKEKLLAASNNHIEEAAM